MSFGTEKFVCGFITFSRSPAFFAEYSLSMHACPAGAPHLSMGNGVGDSWRDSDSGLKVRRKADKIFVPSLRLCISVKTKKLCLCICSMVLSVPSLPLPSLNRRCADSVGFKGQCVCFAPAAADIELHDCLRPSLSSINLFFGTDL